MLEVLAKALAAEEDGLCLAGHWAASHVAACGCRLLGDFAGAEAHDLAEPHLVLVVELNDRQVALAVAPGAVGRGRIGLLPRGLRAVKDGLEVKTLQHWQDILLKLVSQAVALVDYLDHDDRVGDEELLD